MFKKFLSGVLFSSAMFVSTNIASAQDVWVYADDNVTVYVDDTTYSRGAGDGGTHVYAKWVSNSSGQLIQKKEWYFYSDEGYLTAWQKNIPASSVKIAKIHNTAYTAPVSDRPDLVAIYNWIQTQPKTTPHDWTQENFSKEISVLGGIPLGATEEYIKQLYGESTSVQDKIYDADDGYCLSRILKYGDTFELCVNVDDRVHGLKNYLWSAKSTGNNGITTSRGITVGSSVADVRRAYRDIKLKDYNDGTINADTPPHHLRFTIKNNKVAAITIYSKG